jgi:PEP-CTERM motif
LNVTYNFVVQGPSGVVPIIVTGSGSEGGTSTGVDANFNSLDAALQVSGPGVSVLNYFPQGGPGSFTLNNTSSYQANQSYQIQMIAEGAANAGYGGSASFFANVDPVFKIDPTFANANEYSLLFSPGVGNSVSPVPLPSTWGMMLMGLIGLGFIGYRQKSNRALMAA